MNGNDSPDAVRNLAYQLWMERGCASGSPQDDWFRAEQMLRDEHKKVDAAAGESFPASDPPAVHLGDEPPVNAGDKWEAAGKASRANRRSGGGSAL